MSLVFRFPGWKLIEVMRYGDDKGVILYARWWSDYVHRINRRRYQFDEHHHLVEDSELVDSKFRNYFRLNRDLFSEVLSLIK